MEIVIPSNYWWISGLSCLGALLGIFAIVYIGKGIIILRRKRGKHAFKKGHNN